jgi:hypothetical protein
MTCTTLDHVYPGTSHPLTPGTPCYCGARTVGGVTRKPLKKGGQARVFDTVVTIIGKERGEDIYRIDQIVKGRTLFEAGELEAL